MLDNIESNDNMLKSCTPIDSEAQAGIATVKGSSKEVKFGKYPDLGFKHIDTDIDSETLDRLPHKFDKPEIKPYYGPSSILGSADSVEGFQPRVAPFTVSQLDVNAIVNIDELRKNMQPRPIIYDGTCDNIIAILCIFILLICLILVS